MSHVEQNGHDSNIIFSDARLQKYENVFLSFVRGAGTKLQAVGGEWS